jgi:hypothetical protein
MFPSGRQVTNGGLEAAYFISPRVQLHIPMACVHANLTFFHLSGHFVQHIDKTAIEGECVSKPLGECRCELDLFQDCIHSEC